MQALSCSTSSLGLSNSWVHFLYPGTSALQLDLARGSAGELEVWAGRRLAPAHEERLQREPKLSNSILFLVKPLGVRSG